MTRSRFACALALGLVASASSAQAQFCSDPVGRLAGFVVGEESVTVVDDSYLSVKRGEADVAATNGMPICPGDVITIEVGAAAIMELGQNGQSANEVTLVGRSIIEVENPGTITARIGRIFALLRGKFDVRISDGSTLGARGTQFELRVGDTIEVTQLEDRVELTRPTGETLVVEARQQLSAPGAGPGAATTMDLDRGRCGEVTRANSTIVARTRPQLPTENHVPALAAATRSEVFAAARERFLCDQQGASRIELVQAYADWGRSDSVLELVEGLPAGSSARQRAVYAASVGDGYRQVGEADTAVAWYRQALDADASFAVPYNGIGDALRDRALANMRPNGRGAPASVAADFAAAENAYLRALSPDLDGLREIPKRTAVFINLGDLALLRTTVDPATANDQLAAAVHWFERALEDTGQDAPFAEVGLARVDLLRAALIPDVTIEGGDLGIGERLAVQLAIGALVELQRRPHRAAARDRLERVLARYGEFSAAALALGQVYVQMGDRTSAAARFRTAIRSDPSNVIAYSHLANSLPGNRNREERALYESAYRAAVRPTAQPILERRFDLRGTLRAAPIVLDIRALSPSPPALNFQRTDREGQVVTFTNTGAQPATVGAISITGANSQVYRRTGGSCASQTLQPQGSCTVIVSFLATDAGKYFATLVVGSSTGVDAQVALEGSIVVYPIL